MLDAIMAGGMGALIGTVTLAAAISLAKPLIYLVGLSYSLSCSGT